ncbi:hypothetical protein TWF481_009663 [Arthrobotrys musiformis]|uniref:Fungal N-terminal domain-containing protein n=1 Tax=Arthrobotrys musiformis TaxID=47236 RepID=A0AAV9W6E6_9PEZI
MNQISSGLEYGLLNIGVPIGLMITRLSHLVKEVEFAQSILEDLLRDFKDTERQLSSLNEFLELAEFSPEQHHQCKYLIQGLHLKANKLTNLIDCIGMKLTQRNFFRRSRHRLSLVDSDLGNVRRYIEKINQTISVIRQEMLLAIVINSRNEQRSQNEAIVKEVQRVNRNITGTDAREIRKIYRVVAIELMYQRNFPPAVPVPAHEAQPNAQSQPRKQESSTISPVSPVSTLEVLPTKDVAQLQVDFNPGLADLADVTEALGRILERSSLGQPSMARISQIVELPA